MERKTEQWTTAASHSAWNPTNCINSHACKTALSDTEAARQSFIHSEKIFKDTVLHIFCGRTHDLSRSFLLQFKNWKLSGLILKSVILTSTNPSIRRVVCLISLLLSSALFVFQLSLSGWYFMRNE